MTENMYDPSKSRISEDILADFLRAPITGDITEVPGITRTIANKLSSCEDNITNTFQLIGKFLILKTKKKDKYITGVEHCELFYNWLGEIGIVYYRHDIVMCLAEKINTMIPGLYDYDDYSK